MTSVGSGSLMIVSLLLMYPTLRASQLVGTDLVQAVPLVASASLGHILFGDFQFSLTASLLIGALPGSTWGPRCLQQRPGGIVRRALVFVLLASALKLLNASNTTLVIVPRPWPCSARFSGPRCIAGRAAIHAANVQRLLADAATSRAWRHAPMHRSKPNRPSRPGADPAQSGDPPNAG